MVIEIVAVGRVHNVTPVAAGLLIELVKSVRETIRSPPLRQMFGVSPRFPHEFARRVQDTRADNLSARRAFPDWILVKAKDIARGISESCGNFRRVRTDWLQDLTAAGNNRIARRRDAVHHDVDQQAGLSRRLPAQHPSAADFTHTVIESRGAVAALSDMPTERRFVKRGRAIDVEGGHLDVAHLAVSEYGMLLGFQSFGRTNQVLAPSTFLRRTLRQNRPVAGFLMVWFGHEG